MVGHRNDVHRHFSHHLAQRSLHRQYDRSVEHAGSDERRYHDGLLFSFGGDGCSLPHRTENTCYSHFEDLVAHRLIATGFLQPDLCTDRQHGRHHGMLFLHGIPQRFRHARVHHPDPSTLQSQKHTK